MSFFIFIGMMMAISSTSFGVYYYILNEVHNNTVTTAAPLTVSTSSLVTLGPGKMINSVSGRVIRILSSVRSTDILTYTLN